jgi:hypothetical protein
MSTFVTIYHNENEIMVTSQCGSYYQIWPLKMFILFFLSVPKNKHVLFDLFDYLYMMLVPIMVWFSHSIDDITCYLLYVLDFSHWKCYLYTYVLNVSYKPLRHLGINKFVKGRNMLKLTSPMSILVTR